MKRDELTRMISAHGLYSGSVDVEIGVAGRFQFTEHAAVRMDDVDEPGIGPVQL